MDGLSFKSNGEVTDFDGKHVGFHDETSNENSTILAILEYEDTTGNADLDTQLDENATKLFERKVKYNTLEKIEDALQKGIYG